MKQKELWAEQYDRAHCMGEAEEYYKACGSTLGPYGNSWLAGFEFAKAKLQPNGCVPEIQGLGESDAGPEPEEKTIKGEK